MRIKIQALNEQGKAAILQHLKENAKMSKFHPRKILYNKLFQEDVISEQPYILRLTIKNEKICELVKFEDLKMQILKNLMQNKADEEDFLISEG